ncbi:MAG: ribosome biogenesis GTPase Der [Candidatus Schekmanbacteria bacterium]|nr:MAG: ribosome biogenesis GTPase Der [Candidatus Schekmanbacteria bacterium]
MQLKSVSIIGRPNVGKSTLFNALVGKKKALTSNTPGTTRDRVEAIVTADDKQFILSDTGGYDEEKDELKQLVKKETVKSVERSEIIIFLIDGKTGVTPIDKELADIVRKSGKPIIPVVSKCDLKKAVQNANEIYELGFEEYLLISAQHRIGLDELLEKISSLIIEPSKVEEERILKISILGRPNAGKSSIANSLVGDERVIVSEIPGTTIDSIDILLDTPEGKMMIIDNPGIRKKMKIKDKRERESVITGINTLKNCDIAILVIDSAEGITDQDLKIANLIYEENAGFILLCNKWDLIKDKGISQNDFISFVRMRLGKLNYPLILTVSAKTGYGITRIFRALNLLKEKMRKRYSTSELNSFLKTIEKEHHHPSASGKIIKLKYIHQLPASKPLFQIFTNHPNSIDKTYVRYIEKRFREYFDFEGLPIKFKFRKK